MKKEDIARTGLTTHDLSPDMFIGYLEEMTGADIYMLAVQPENVSFGEGMSDSMKAASGEIIENIVDVLKEQNDA